MSEVENNDKNNFGSNYAIAGISVFIFNEKGELLLTRQPRWKNQWLIPGGKIEYGESIEQAIKREVKEEVNLDIKNIKFFKFVELLKTKERPLLHQIVNQFVAEVESGEVKLDEEGSEYGWRLPEEWLKEKDVYPLIRQAIEYYVNEYSKNEKAEDKYKRALADYQNLLKQTAKEKEEFAKYANEALIEQILPVYDHLKMALEHANNTPVDAKNVVEGVQHIVKQFKGTLEKFGVKEIKTIGQKFDHNLMEAVSDEPTEDANLDHTVAKQIKGGYTLNGKVIVPARVAVYKMKN